MYKKRARTIALVSVLCFGSVGALAMIPADPETVARIGTTSSLPSQSETLASIDAMLGPKGEPVASTDTSPAPIDRAALAAATPAPAAIETAALIPPAETPAPIEATDAIGQSAVNLRSGPSTSAATVSVLQPGQPIQISGEQDGWIEVTLPDGSTGWVYARYVAGNEPAEAAPKPPAAKANDKEGGTLTGRTARIETAMAVRSRPSSGARTVFRTSPGERVRIIGSEDGWLQIRTVSGDLGWIQYAG